MTMQEFTRGGKREGAGRKVLGEDGYDLRIRTYREDRERLHQLKRPGESLSEAVRRLIREEYDRGRPRKPGPPSPAPGPGDTKEGSE